MTSSFRSHVGRYWNWVASQPMYDEHVKVFHHEVQRRLAEMRRETSKYVVINRAAYGSKWTRRNNSRWKMTI
jgi:hypothetical protein